MAILILGVFGADLTLAGSLSKSCPDFLVETSQERVLGKEISVTQFKRRPAATVDSGVPIREPFGEDPQVILGIDTSNSNQPYLVVGQSLFKSTRTSTREQVVYVYNAATKTSLPHTFHITVYHLGELRAENLPEGYFVRISGLTAAQIEELRSGISEQVRIGSSNESWSHLIANLTEGLAKHSDLELACQSPECDYRYDLFERAINVGFRLPGLDQGVKTEFYTIDQGSLEELMKSAKRSKYLSVTGDVVLAGAFGVTTVAMLYMTYQLLAVMTGLPQLPMPF